MVSFSPEAVWMASVPITWVRVTSPSLAWTVPVSPS